MRPEFVRKNLFSLSNGMIAMDFLTPYHFNSSHSIVLLERLSHIYAEMDQAYQQTADFYGFECQGCNDNCCRSLFYHHTLIECLYLVKGLLGLPLDRQKDVMNKAALLMDSSQREMCPLNADGKCLVYAFRPMICRLHGLPHEITLANRSPTQHPGCGEFNRLCSSQPRHLLDRTPHYLALARLEQDTRRQFAYSQRIKMTIAQILTTFTGKIMGSGSRQL
jgi:Fe-S-cluster containining protein